MKESDFLNGNSVIIERLKELPILKSFEEKDIKGLLQVSKVKEFEAGETIIHDGDEDNCIYFILFGKISVVKEGIEICQLGRAGDVFGEMAVIEKRPRSASVEALADTLCLSVDATYIDMLEERDKISIMYIIYRIFAELTANRLRETTNQLIEAKQEIKRLKT